ncbi:hypothetical protein FPOAC2_10062 [Fusarium poae]
MKPVKRSDLEGLADARSMLILDITSWGLSFIYETISHNPSHITSKTGNKTFPTEIWLEIISYAKAERHDHAYKAVYPVEIQSIQMDRGQTEPALVCKGLEEWRLCKMFRGEDCIEAYEKYINKPSRVITEYEADKEMFTKKRHFLASTVAMEPA